MKVVEFSRQVGIPSSKIRYYEKLGLINSDRTENNYRKFNEVDALNIYHALMLRSFNMSIAESLEAQKHPIEEIDRWVEIEKQNLKKVIGQYEMQIYRLNEMQKFFKVISDNDKSMKEFKLGDSFNIFNFGKNITLNNDELHGIKILANSMPFSYIAVKISKESIFNDNPEVSIGLGILENNIKKIGTNIPSSITKTKGSNRMNMYLEVTNPFEITKKDIKPIIDYIEKEKITLKDDIIGRIFLSYYKGNEFVHAIGVGVV